MSEINEDPGGTSKQGIAELMRSEATVRLMSLIISMKINYHCYAH